MVKYISFGQFNKKYSYILGSVTTRLINTYIIGYTPLLTPNNTIYIFDFKSNLFSHPLIPYCFQYFSVFLGGIILNYVFNKKNKDKDIIIDTAPLTEDLDYTSSREFIFNDKDKNNYFKYYLRIFLVFSLYYFAKVSITTFDNMGYNKVKYWTLEFIFLYIFSKKILHRSIYRHQKLSLIILLIICTIISIIVSLIPNSNKDCSSLSGKEYEECELLKINIYEDIEKKLDGYFIPIIILIYIAGMASNAFSSIVSKWFMDIRYINLNKILIYLGSIGFFYSLIFLISFSYIPCSKDNKIISYVCKFNHSGEFFYENIKAFDGIEINSDFYIDIFVLIPLFIICSFLHIFFEFLIIKDLDPFYFMPIDCIVFLIYDIVDYSKTYWKSNSYRDSKFALQVSTITIAIFLCSIYLEIVELHFCSFDLYLRRNIIQRGQKEKLFLLKDMEKISAETDNTEQNEE